MEQFVLASGNNTERVAGNLASAVGGRVETCTVPDLTATNAVAQLVARPSESAARETQAGANPAVVAEYLSSALPEDTWVAVSMRTPRRSEVAAVRRWYDHRLGGATTHHSKNSNVLAVSVWAGGPDVASVEGVLSGLPSVLPGFDIETRIRRPMGQGLSAGLLFFTGACLVGLTLVPQLVGLVPHAAIVAVRIVAAVCVVVGVGVASGKIPSAAGSLVASARDGLFRVPSRRATRPRPPHKERTYRVQGPDGTSQERVREEFAGDYPLAQSVFLVGPGVVVGIGSPHAGTASRAAVTSSREVPAVMRQRIGPLVGVAGASETVPVFIDASQRYQGIAAYGMPGSGKSALVTTVFAYDLHSRLGKVRYQGDPVGRRAMIGIESKGAEGLAAYQRWLALTNTPAWLCEVADRSTPAIDMFTGGGSVADRAGVFVDSMVFAFGEQSIAYRSAHTLKSVFTAALLVTDADLDEAGLPFPMDAVRVASVLLALDGDDAGDRLAGALTTRAAKMGRESPDGVELYDAVQRLSPLYGAKVTAAQRRALVEAPQSKVALLLENGGAWWDSARQRIRFSDVLQQHQVLVINSGVSSSGLIPGDALTKHLTSMLLYGLQKSIEATCSGWREQGRAVSIYSDELSLLVGGGDPSTFVWLRNQGRSYGVEPVFASQQPETLPKEVRSVVQSFGTFCWFKQNDAATISAALDDLNAGGGSWTASDVTRLPDHHALVRATVAGQRQDPIPVRMLWWGQGGERSFPADQGFDDPFPGFELQHPTDLAVAACRQVVPSPES